MLNEKLNNIQSVEPRIQDVNAHLGNTGIAGQPSANEGRSRIARQRLQRMRRRHQRSVSTLRPVTGWVTRMAS